MFFTRHMQRGERLEVERQTEKFDSEAMSYLSYILYPLVVAGAVYQLVYSSYKRYVPHLGYNTSSSISRSPSVRLFCQLENSLALLHSWYSWVIHSLVNGRSPTIFLSVLLVNTCDGLLHFPGVYAFGFLFMLPQLFLNYKVHQ